MKRHYTAGYLLAPTHPITINLIGCGGTGSQVLTCLARIHQSLSALGHPGLNVSVYDPDEVTEANIARQLFSLSDVGLNKAEVLVTRINRFFGLDWLAYPCVYKNTCNRHANILISCVDTVQSRQELVAVKNCTSYDPPFQSYYWMDFGNGRRTGQVVLGTLTSIEQPKIKSVKTVARLKTVLKLFDLSSVNEADSGPSCSLAEALNKQDLFINSTLAQLGCALLWKLLSTGSVDYQGMFLNLETMKVNPIKL